MTHVLVRPFIAAVATFALCAPPIAAVGAPSDGPPDAKAQRHVASASVGRIVAIDPIQTRPMGSGAGAVAGGVVGGVLGNQVFGGTAATVIGAAGGAVAGNNLERNHRSGVTGYRVTVRLDNGHERTFTPAQVGGLKVGDRVRIRGERLQRI
jgi:outer membrane lipoprotein SlyB